MSLTLEGLLDSNMKDTYDFYLHSIQHKAEEDSCNKAIHICVSFQEDSREICSNLQF